MERVHPLSHVAGSEVNGSRPVGSGHYALKSPSDCARDFRLDDPTYSIHTHLFDIFLVLFSFFFFFFFFELCGARWQSSFSKVSHHLGV